MTDSHVAIAGWIYYDHDCGLCREGARRMQKILTRRRFQLRTLQSPDAPRELGLSGSALLREVRVLLADGRNLGGADAMLEVARRIWWACPIWILSLFPGVRPLLRAAYRVVAANRHCISGLCTLPRLHTWHDWLPLLLLPATVVAIRNMLPAWVFMWLLAYAIFLGCKWFTLRRAATRPTLSASLAYLFTWPGMDANAFLTTSAIERPGTGRWLTAVAESIVGASLLWVATSRSIDLSPLLTGWLGMVGLVMMLHFGFFHLLALGWRAAGRKVRPLMRAPLLSTSLTDFWGSRWNTAFHELANMLIFRKLARPLGVVWATLAVFLVSGVVHDLVISLPARGGYGLPTAYFLLQGAGVLFERSRFGRSLGLAHGWRGWVFMFIIVTAPAYWLFHPPFVRNVILPMLDAIGAAVSTP